MGHQRTVREGDTGVMRLTAALGRLGQEAGIRVNCVCPGWVETQAVRRALDEMTAEERGSFTFPPPPVLIQPAGRVMVWPDGEPPRLIPADARY